MKVTSLVPSNWENLQNEVCRFFNEAGYIAKTTKIVETVRGEVEVDVFVESNHELIKSFICECKYWNSNIPQEKVHAFRTVVHDSGSTLGIIIAKKGFQSGAYNAAKCSNVLLKNWDEFINMISEQWTDNQLSRVNEIANPLSVYTDPLDVPIKELSDEAKKTYIKVTEDCLRAYLLIRSMKRDALLKEKIELNDIVFFELDMLFEYCEEIFIKAIEQYEKIFKDTSLEEWKFKFGEYE